MKSTNSPAIDAVHLDGARIDLAIGLDVLVVAVAGQAAVDHLDTADFDNAVPVCRLQAGGLGIQNNLSHLLALHILLLE
jgi:hypothetical protein